MKLKSILLVLQVFTPVLIGKHINVHCGNTTATKWVVQSLSFAMRLPSKSGIGASLAMLGSRVPISQARLTRWQTWRHALLMTGMNGNLMYEFSTSGVRFLVHHLLTCLLQGLISNYFAIAPGNQIQGQHIWMCFS